MAGREVREYTNLSDPKDKKFGKGRIDDEDIAFQRMVSKMQDVAGERGGYLHGRGALDSDDLLYLKEQMEAEEDAERLLRRTEKRAFAAFKQAASAADASPASIPLALRVESKPKSGIRQQDLLKRVVEVKPKRPRVSSPSSSSQLTTSSVESKTKEETKTNIPSSSSSSPSALNRTQEHSTQVDNNPVKSLLVAYETSDDEED